MGIRFASGGESHGPAVVAIIEGLPAGLALSADDINRDLARRQSGYGRGARMGIEKDSVKILSGVRAGLTMGSPVTLMVENRDYDNWKDTMDVGAPSGDAGGRTVTRPRPGHGDLAGMLKYGHTDARDVLERASARETAARVAAGATARRLLAELGVKVSSRVVALGGVDARGSGEVTERSFVGADDSPVRCVDEGASRLMMEAIDGASRHGETLGGVFEVAAFGLVPGLGSPAVFDRRLDARITGAVASIPGVKGVEVGAGFALGRARGSEAHDEIFYDEKRGLYRRTNRAGGLEAGMTNGEPLLIRAVMKPIPTLGRPLKTVDVLTLEPAEAAKERADVCAVPAAAVVGEAMVALVLADASVEKFGGDSMDEIERNLRGYLDSIGRLWRREG